MQKQPTQYNNSNIPPDNNLVWAIASTVLCCPPTGIYAIIKASEVDKKWKNGDYEGAYRSAKDAKNWSIAGVVIVVGFILLNFIFPFLFAILRSLSSVI